MNVTAVSHVHDDVTVILCLSCDVCILPPPGIVYRWHRVSSDSLRNVQVSGPAARPPNFSPFCAKLPLGLDTCFCGVVLFAVGVFVVGAGGEMAEVWPHRSSRSYCGYCKASLSGTPNRGVFLMSGFPLYGGRRKRARGVFTFYFGSIYLFSKRAILQFSLYDTW